MVCDYYIQTELVIEFSEMNGSLSKTTTNRMINRGYIMNIPDNDSDDDYDTQDKKYKKELEKKISENTYQKMLYENDRWVKSSYEKRYLRNITILCPTMIKLIRVYKDISAFSSV